MVVKPSDPTRGEVVGKTPTEDPRGLAFFKRLGAFHGPRKVRPHFCRGWGVEISPVGDVGFWCQGQWRLVDFLAEDVILQDHRQRWTCEPVAILPDIFSFAVARNLKNHILGPWGGVNWITCLCFVIYLLEMPNTTYLSGLDAFCVSNKEVTLCPWYGFWRPYVPRLALPSSHPSLTRQDGNATVLSDLLRLGSKKAPRPGPVSLSIGPWC